MDRSVGWCVVVVCGVVLAGCDETPAMTGSDAGMEDAASSIEVDAFLDVDAGEQVDSSVDAFVPPDTGRPCGTGFCTADEACVRDVCIADCGLDLAGLDAALGAGLTPVQNFCVIAAGPLAVDVPSTGEPWVYEIVADTTGRDTSFLLARWRLDPAAPAPSIETVGAATYSAPADDVMVFLGGYLAIAPGGGAALFGYTTTKAGFVGGVFDMLTGDGTVSELPGPGNFDAAWIDDDTYVVNGSALDGIAGGQGLYVHDRSGGGSSEHAVTALGSYSGGVAMLDASTVLAGGVHFGVDWADGSSGSRIFAIPLASVLAGTTAAPLDADATASIPRAEAPSAFTWLPGRGIASERWAPDFSAFEAIEVRSVSVAGSTLTVGEPEDLGTADVRRVTPVGGTRLLLHHGGGLLLVE